MFSKLEGDVALLVVAGVYKVCDLYEMDGKAFAGVSGGFVRLYENGSTSKPKMQIERVHTDVALYKDRLGRLTFDATRGTSQLVPATSTLLIGKA